LLFFYLPIGVSHHNNASTKKRKRVAKQEAGGSKKAKQKKQQTIPTLKYGAPVSMLSKGAENTLLPYTLLGLLKKKKRQKRKQQKRLKLSQST